VFTLRVDPRSDRAVNRPQSRVHTVDPGPHRWIGRRDIHDQTAWHVQNLAPGHLNIATAEHRVQDFANQVQVGAFHLRRMPASTARIGVDPNFALMVPVPLRNLLADPLGVAVLLDPDFVDTARDIFAPIHAGIAACVPALLGQDRDAGGDVEVKADKQCRLGIVGAGLDVVVGAEGVVHLIPWTGEAGFPFLKVAILVHRRAGLRQHLCRSLLAQVQVKDFAALPREVRRVRQVAALDPFNEVIPVISPGRGADNVEVGSGSHHHGRDVLMQDIRPTVAVLVDNATVPEAALDSARSIQTRHADNAAVAQVNRQVAFADVPVGVAGFQRPHRHQRLEVCPKDVPCLLLRRRTGEEPPGRVQA